VIRLNLGKFLDKCGMVNIQTAKTGERFGGTGTITTFDEITRCLRKDEHACNKNNGPRKLDSDWNAIGASIVAVLGGIVDDSCKEQTDCNGPLIATNNRTTDLAHVRH
jgi:hypothetical protein